MKWIFSLFLASLMVLNFSLLGYEVVINGIDDGPGSNGGGGPDEVASDITKLTVPLPRIGDQILYDYSLFAQLYSANYSSGEWERYTLTGEGELLQYIDELTEVEDGFQATRASVKSTMETRAYFSMRIEGSERDEVVIPGNLELQRDEFRNLFDKHALKATNAGMIHIDNLGGAFGSLPANVDYTADLRTYPDPHVEPIETLDEAIFGKSQTLKLDSKGVYVGDPIWGEDIRQYNWSVVGAYKVNDIDSLKINVSSDIWSFIFFHRTFYVSASSPFPLKGYTRTNMSAVWDDGEFYVIFETTRTLKDSETALRTGNSAIPWGDASGNKEYDTRHPAGEYMDWDYAPSDGTDVDRSSFSGFTLNEAISYARTTSPELGSFLEEYESKGRVLIQDSVWNSSTEDRLGRNRTTWWNLTFGYVYSLDEMEEYYRENNDWPEWRYRLLVARSTVTNPLGGATTSNFISKDEGDDYHGRRKVYWGDGVMEDYLQLEPEVLTLTHGEKILRIDNDIKAEAYKNNVLTEDTVFYYGIVGVNENTVPSMLLLEQLTGIRTPTSDNSYGLQKADVWSTGSTFGAAVDANTGMLLYVTKVEGDQLASIFGG